MSRPQIENRLQEWANQQMENMRTACTAMAASIVRGAQDNAPVDTGALRASGRVEELQNGAQAAFGGESVGVAYARIWELGDPWHLNPHFHGITRDGRLAPLYYLKNAGDAVAERGMEVYL